MSNVCMLPIWKKGATAAERFEELAQYAREKPERFEKYVVVYLEKGNDHAVTLRKLSSYNMTHIELIGMLECAKLDADAEVRYE